MKKIMLPLLLLTAQSANAGIPVPDYMLLKKSICEKLPAMCFQDDKEDKTGTDNTFSATTQTTDQPSKEDS